MMILNVRTQAPTLIGADNAQMKLEQYLHEQQEENRFLFETIAKAITDLEKKLEDMTAQEEGEDDGEVT